MKYYNLIKTYKLPDGNYNVLTPDISQKKIKKVEHLLKKELFVLAFVDKVLYLENIVEKLKKIIDEKDQIIYDKHKLILGYEEVLDEYGL